MGARYADLKRENAELRMALQAFVQKHSVAPGDLLLFKTHDVRKLGVGFGVGYGGMHNIRAHLEAAARGPVTVMASTEGIDIQHLDARERQKLRELLDQVDRLAPKYGKNPANPQQE